MTPATDTYLLLRALVDELARCGMQAACTSPGSRCAPLVLTLAREQRLRCYSHIDERCAGFFALGLAKASGLPVAVTCTSGTAAAELAPAAIEAFHARVPLLLLTADRPPELRENGAGQAIDQLKLFGDAAKWFFEVGTHDASAERLRWMRTLACRAYHTALEDRPGVVHLNFPLREPLVLDGELPQDSTGRPDGRPYVLRRPIAAVGTGDVFVQADPTGTAHAASAMGTAGGVSDRRGPYLQELVAKAKRGVLVAGRHERPTALGEAAAAFCEAVGWPLLADPLSGARRGTAAIAHYDALLRDDAFAAGVVPDLVIRVGDLPISKPLRTWLAGLGETMQVALDPEGAWQDPVAVLTESLALEPAGTLAELTASRRAAEAQAADTDWLAGWRAADEQAAETILGTLDPHEGFSEPVIATELGTLLPETATLFVSSSMPVREIETFWPIRDDPPRVLCNRGANGIDGIVSSAFGAAAHADGPVVLLIGDVALAHDIGGLLAAQRLELKLTIVLVDNGGGGIFDFLPISHAPMATEHEIYANHIATPTGLDFERAAALYGLNHEHVETVPTFRAALERALSPQAGSAIVHAPTDRARNVELHRRVWANVAHALDGARGEET
jgi:2-succinyl-5-enolpyruvyl-6-hydroxy-3-cyclohexene-1-carboxylate synthase